MTEETREIIVAGTSALAVERAPEMVLDEAHRAAKTLKTVLDQKPNKVMMGNEQYMEFEDWQTLGRFYGVTAREDGDAEYVQFGDVKGFKASAVALNKDGDEISRATAFCLSDEEKWGSRPKYVYGYICKDGSWSEDDPGRDQIIWEDNPSNTGKKRPKKERRQVGDEQVPLFQLASMAQTRACAKCLRNVLSWVAVLAGYRPTPAEELEGMTTREPTAASRPEPNGRGAQRNAAPQRAPAQPSTDAEIIEGDFIDSDVIPFDEQSFEVGGIPPTTQPIPRTSKLWQAYMAVRDEARTVLPEALLERLPAWNEPRSKGEVEAAGKQLREALDAAKAVGVTA